MNFMCNKFFLYFSGLTGGEGPDLLDRSLTLGYKGIRVLRLVLVDQISFLYQYTRLPFISASIPDFVLYGILFF